MDTIQTKEITLHNRSTIPSLGFKIQQMDGVDIYHSIMDALEIGYRHFDIPSDPQIEKIAGKAFSECSVPRYDLFISLKLGNDDHGYEPAIRALDNSLKRLNMDYVDLYLIDWPNPVKYRAEYKAYAEATWKALETVYKNGKAHAIGLANFEARHIENCLETAEIAPMVNQARIYPGFPFNDNLDCANAHRIQTEGYLPANYTDLLSSHELQIFAKKYSTTPRAICVRYLLEKGCIALIQSSSKEEMQECYDAFRFTISDDDMKFMDVMKNYGPDNINPDTCDF